MGFCHHCGTQASVATATFCQSCGAPLAAASAAAAASASPETPAYDVSAGWKEKFALIDQAGGPRLPQIRALPFWKRSKVTFNAWGFLFGPFYYLAKGMPRKAATLTLITFLLILVVLFVATALHSSFLMTTTKFIGSVIFATRANVDFYKKIVLNNHQWI